MPTGYTVLSNVAAINTMLDEGFWICLDPYGFKLEIIYPIQLLLREGAILLTYMFGNTASWWSLIW